MNNPGFCRTHRFQSMRIAISRRNACAEETISSRVRSISARTSAGVLPTLASLLPFTHCLRELGMAVRGQDCNTAAELIEGVVHHLLLVKSAHCRVAAKPPT